MCVCRRWDIVSVVTLININEGGVVPLKDYHRHPVVTTTAMRTPLGDEEGARK